MTGERQANRFCFEIPDSDRSVRAGNRDFTTRGMKGHAGNRTAILPGFDFRHVLQPMPDLSGFYVPDDQLTRFG